MEFLHIRNVTTTYQEVPLPPCHHIRLYQILDTDAARCFIRFVEGDLPEHELFVGSRMSLATSFGASRPPVQAMQVPDRVRDDQPVRVRVRAPLGSVEYPQNIVLACCHRPDAMDDLWQHFHEVLQVSDISAVATFEDNVIADFSDKDILEIPCRHFRSGNLQLECDDTRAGVLSVACRSFIGPDVHPFHVVPLAIIPCATSDDNPNRMLSIPFQCDPNSDTLIIRAWNLVDGQDCSITGGRVVLSTRPLTENRNNWSDGGTYIAASATTSANNIVAAACNLPAKADIGYMIENLSGVNALSVRLTWACNMGRNTNEDQHSRDFATIGPVAASTVLTGTQQGHRMDAVSMALHAASAVATSGRCSISVSDES